MRHQRLVRVFVIDAVPPVSLVQPRKDFMRFVDYGEVELSRSAERRRPALATREFPANQIYAGSEEIRPVLACLNAK